MSRRCDLTGKGVLVGHKVSHSNIMISDTLGRSVRLKVSANALKTVDHRGGLDAYLMGAKNDVLAPKMRDLKKAIAKKQAAG
jgi:large subunit ribosomal protein L28